MDEREPDGKRGSWRLIFARAGTGFVLLVAAVAAAFIVFASLVLIAFGGH